MVADNEKSLNYINVQIKRLSGHKILTKHCVPANILIRGHIVNNQ